MSSDTRSARERFVETMLRLEALETNGEGYNSHPGHRYIREVAEQAIDAFADAECKVVHPEHCCRLLHNLCDCHAACRAALRKECGL